MRLTGIFGDVRWRLGGPRWRATASNTALWDLIGEGLVGMDLEAGEIFQTLPLEDAPYAALSADGTFLAAKRAAGFTVSQLPSMELVWKHDTPLKHVALSGDGATVAVASESGRVRVWRVGRPDPITEIEGHHVWLSPTGKSALTKKRDSLKPSTSWSATTLVDIETGNTLWQGESRLAWDVAWSNTGSVAWIEWGDEITILDPTVGPRTIPRAKARSLFFLTHGRDECLALAHDGKIIVVDTATGEPLRTIADVDHALALTPDQKTFVTAGWGIRAVDIATGETRGRNDRPDVVDQIRFDQRGTTALLRFRDGFGVWDRASGLIKRQLPAVTMARLYASASATAQFVDDGRAIAIVDADATVWLVVGHKVCWKTRLGTSDWAFTRARLAQEGDRLVVHASWNRSLGVEPDGYEDFEYRHTSETLRLSDGTSLGQVERAESALTASEPATNALPDQAALVLKYGAFTTLGMTPQRDRVLVGTTSGALLEFVEDDKARHFAIHGTQLDARAVDTADDKVTTGLK